MTVIIIMNRRTKIIQRINTKGSNMTLSKIITWAVHNNRIWRYWLRRPQLSQRFYKWLTKTTLWPLAYVTARRPHSYKISTLQVLGMIHNNLIFRSKISLLFQNKRWALIWIKSVLSLKKQSVSLNHSLQVRMIKTRSPSKMWPFSIIQMNMQCALRILLPTKIWTTCKCLSNSFSSRWLSTLLLHASSLIWALLTKSLSTKAKKKTLILKAQVSLVVKAPKSKRTHMNLIRQLIQRLKVKNIRITQEARNGESIRKRRKMQKNARIITPRRETETASLITRLLLENQRKDMKPAKLAVFKPQVVRKTLNFQMVAGFAVNAKITTLRGV